MNDDVTIPRETAQEVAETLRSLAPVSGGLSSGRQLLKYADLLDPPQPSLREEVAHSLLLNIREDRTGRYAADAVLAVVRRYYRERIADLSPWSGRNWDGYTPEEGYEAGRNDALALFKDES